MRIGVYRNGGVLDEYSAARYFEMRYNLETVIYWREIGESRNYKGKF